MAVCLEYQAVYYSKRESLVSMRTQIIAALLLLAALCCKVWIKVESTNLGYDLAKERQKTIAMDMERRELELQLSVLLRADTLGRLAHTRLGLDPLNVKQARKIQY
jgi:hypothetical protein